MIGDPAGVTPPRAVALPANAFYDAATWSPDGTQILLEDNHNNLWAIEAASGAATKIDTDNNPDPIRQFSAAWSPDSKWITYSRNLPNHLRAVFVYSSTDKKSYQVTDGLADSISPTFDAGGKYLYFMASTNYGPSTSWLEMSSLDRPVRRAIYLVVLNANEPSPLLPETGDEPKPPSGEAPKPEPKPAVRIDLNGISQRVLAVNIPVGDYNNLTAGAAGTFYYTEPFTGGAPGTLRLQRYQLRERAAAPFLEGSIRSYSISADRKKLLYQAGDGANRWGVVSTERPAKVGDGPLNVAQLETRVDPRAEWSQIYRETWRIQRDYFYDAKMHGADWQAIYEKYKPLLAFVGHRADLGYVIAMMGGELTVGHSYLTAPGDVPSEDRKLMGYFALRDGTPSTSPIAGIYGPKVMLINESAGSGGDALPYMFRLRKIGPLIGSRTWGGLVGTLGIPATIDGGGITAPSLAFYNLKGEWDVENIGVAPDIEVEYTAADVMKGRDPQLERAVQEALRLLELNPVRRVPRPAPIDRVSRGKER